MVRILWHSYALFMSKFKYIIWEAILEFWVKLYPGESRKISSSAGDFGVWCGRWTESSVGGAEKDQ